MQLVDIPSLRRAFGSYAKAANALGMSPQALNDARRRGNLPRHRYLTQKAALESVGFEAAESLWGFEELKPKRRKSSVIGAPG